MTERLAKLPVISTTSPNPAHLMLTGLIFCPISLKPGKTSIGRLKRRNVTYAQLVDKLAAIGVEESEPNVRNKLARGKFSAAFLVQCLTALGSSSLRLD